MKKLYKYITFVIGIVAFCACTDEMDFPKVVVESGKDVTLNLKVQTQNVKDVVVSRTATEDERTLERTLNDLHIYIFDAEGILTGYKKQTFGNDDGVHIVNEEYTVNNIQTQTGPSYIYAIANIESSTTTYFLSPEDKTLLTDPFTGGLEKEDLLNIKFQRETTKAGINQSPTPTGVYMMSGYLNNGNPVNITENKTIEPVGNSALNSTDKVIKLYRILAKNTLNIKTFSKTVIDENTGEEKLAYKGKFTPKYYRLWNVPNIGTLVPNANIETTSTYLAGNITDLTEVGDDGNLIRHLDSGYQVYSADSVITFYYPENLQIAKSEEEVAACQENIAANEKVASKKKNEWVWKDRETNRWNSARTEKKYIYADDDAAYIEIQGEYTYKKTEIDGNGNTIVTDDITANVTYTIHLGDFATDIQDFNVIRNSHYIYNVTINGVEDIKVEAQRWVVGDAPNQKPVENPYAEGLVINAKKGKHYDVDAHYEARVMSFTKKSIKKLKGEGSGYIFNISTVFGNTPQTVTVKADNVKEINGNLSYDINIYDLSGNHLATLQNPNELTKVSTNVANVFNGEQDFTWIKFVRNGATKHNTVGSSTDNMVLGSEDTHICMYPGDGKPKYLYNYDANGKFTGRSIQYAGGWMNVFELLAELYYTDDTNDGETANDVYKHRIVTGDDIDYVAYYTCFIDENYYYDKSWDQYATWVKPGDPNGGKKNPRTMLIANNLDISQDGKSLYAEVQYSISQRPISTFYTNTTKKAFGTELIDEEDKYSKPPYNAEVRLGGFENQMTYYNNMTMTNQDNWNAWTCADKTVKNSTKYNNSWYLGGNYSDVKAIEGVQPLYRAVAKACMSRNRDLDGDGQITSSTDPSKNEVRWYLAAIDQYRALFYAQNVLDSDAHFINDEELTDINNAYVMGEDYGYGPANSWNGKRYGNQDNDQNGHDYRGQYHYWTSSPSDYAGTFWPEEGCTNNKATTSGFVQRAELIRCIRTLQSGNGKNQENYGTSDPDKYYDFNKNGDNKFEMNGITVARGYYDGPLEIHNEREPANELYANFIVASESMNLGNGSSTNTLRDGEDPCYTRYTENVNGVSGIGKWRLPNQKEFALMLSEISGLRSGNYGTRTGFSGSDYSRNPEKYWNWHNSTGFGSTGGNLNLTENSNPNVRCVRDVR